MNISDINRNDVLAINGKRYEVLQHSSSPFGSKERVVELNRLGDNAPRFLLVLQEDDGHEPLQFWERDPTNGELIDVPVRSMEVLGI